MKNLLFIFLFISGLVFSQNKELYKTITYNDVIGLFNEKLKLKNESLDKNLERCAFIVNDAKAKGDDNTYNAFSVFQKALSEAKFSTDKNAAFIKIYTDPDYEFYDSQNKFVGRIYKEKFNETLDIQGNKPETFISSYFYLLQE